MVSPNVNKILEAAQSPPRRRSAAAVKQEMQATLADAQKDAQERRETATTPEQRISA